MDEYGKKHAVYHAQEADFSELELEMLRAMLSLQTVEDILERDREELTPRAVENIERQISIYSDKVKGLEQKLAQKGDQDG